MTARVFVQPALAAAMTLVAGTAVADPIGFDFIQLKYNVATGVRLTFGPVDIQDGLDIEFPVPDYIQNKSYTSQEVDPLSGQASESYAQFGTTKAPGYGSAVASGRNLEVGVDSRIGIRNFSAAVSRMNLSIKNNHEDRSLDLLEFAFEIPAGRVEITDFTRKFVNMRASVGASIDYLLKSPAGPFGGTWDETTGTLFYYAVDIDDGLVLAKTQNATVAAMDSQNGARFGYTTGAYEDTLRLPVIPPLGELTVYYDMYALAFPPTEGLGAAFLGDPLDLTNSGTFSLRLADDPVAVPEPATLSLAAAALLALGVRRARRIRR